MKKSHLKKLIKEVYGNTNSIELSLKDQQIILDSLIDMGLDSNTLDDEDAELYLDAMLPTKYVGNQSAYNFVNSLVSDKI